MPYSSGTYTYKIVITSSNGAFLTSVVNTIIVDDCYTSISIG